MRETPAQQGGFASFPEAVNGPKVRRRSETFADHYSQATLFWQSQTPVEQQHIVEALQFELGKVAVPHVRTRMLANLVNVDAQLAARVASVLGQAVPAASTRNGTKRYPASPKLSMLARGNVPSPVGRKVAILAADGVDGASLQAMKSALTTAGVKVKVLSSRLGRLRAGGGGTVAVDDLIVTMPSVVFDAVYVPAGAESVATLKASGDAVQFVREAFKHAKPVSAAGDGADFLQAAGVLGATKAPGVSTGASAQVSEFLADIAAHRHWARPSNAVAA